MATMKQAQTTLRRQPRREPIARELDPATMSATLRELALRAHQLVRASDTPDRSGNRDRELENVLAQVIRLERNLGENRLDDLAAYVKALKQRVEERLI